METAWQYWTRDIAKRLRQQLDQTISDQDLVVPPDASLGDISFPCFKLAKEQKKSPAELAKKIAESFTIQGAEFQSVTSAGPYVNFTLAIGDAVHRIVRDIETTGVAYGSSNLGAKQKMLFECYNPNTHKEIHVGHLRHLILGVSLTRILRSTGWDVVAMSYHGDVGAHVAKVMWYLVKQAGFALEGLSFTQVDQIVTSVQPNDRTGAFLGHLYTDATTKLAEDDTLQKEISFVQNQLEAHAEAWEHLWQETRRWSVEEMKVIFDELGVMIDRQYFESEVYERGLAMVEELLTTKVAKMSEGAVIVDLEDVKLGVFLIRKSDGASLYATKDLALAERKDQEYPKWDRSLYVTDTRQSFYFKQLFETLRRMGDSRHREHLGYEFLILKEGAMSSRKGNIVTYVQFRDAVVDYARSEILKRHPDWTEGKVVHAAWAIAQAGIKFGILRQDNDKVYTFDLEQALSFDGATGPYCQYAATRLAAILRKAKFRVSSPEAQKDADLSRAFDHQTEKMLALTLASFPRVVEAASRDLRPALIAQWCLEAAQCINEFYRDVPVLDSKDDLLEGRLRLASAARQVLGQGLDLLGIPLPDEM